MSPPTTSAVISLPLGLRLLSRLPLPRKLGLLERIYGRALAAAGEAWVETANGPVWRLDLRSAVHRWIVFGDYEGALGMNWVRGWLGRGGTVIDSGANIGQTLLYFAPIHGVSVLAFEPNPEAANWLEDCLARYPDWRVDLLRLGLSDVSAELPLSVPHFANEHGAQGSLQQTWYAHRDMHQVAIQVAPLDDVLKERGVQKVRLWKLDVEGWEVKALRGASEMLRRRAVDAILVEIAPENAADVAQLLASFSYALHQIDAGGKLVPLTRAPTVMGNFVALPV